jgi:hypothetical protein
MSDNTIVKKTTSVDCINDEYVINTKVSKQVNITIGHSMRYFYAASQWKVYFVVKANDKMTIYDAEAKVQKWERLNKCFYLDPYGHTDLPKLEKDLAKLVGPWVLLVYEKDKLHTQSLIATSDSTLTIQIAPVIVSFVEYLSIPCGTSHYKPIVWPPPTDKGKKPRKHGGHGGVWSLPDNPSQVTSKEDQSNPTPEKYGGDSTTKPQPIQGYELGPSNAVPNYKGVPQLVYQPSPRDVAAGRTKLKPTAGASYEYTKDEKVKAMMATGKWDYVKVTRMPEYDHNYSDRWFKQTGGAGGVTGYTGDLARQAEAYEIQGMKDVHQPTARENYSRSKNLNGSDPGSQW